MFEACFGEFEWEWRPVLESLSRKGRGRKGGGGGEKKKRGKEGYFYRFFFKNAQNFPGGFAPLTPRSEDDGQSTLEAMNSSFV